MKPNCLSTFLFVIPKCNFSRKQESKCNITFKISENIYQIEKKKILVIMLNLLMLKNIFQYFGGDMEKLQGKDMRSSN